MKLGDVFEGVIKIIKVCMAVQNPVSDAAVGEEGSGEGVESMGDERNMVE